MSIFNATSLSQFFSLAVLLIWYASVLAPTRIDPASDEEEAIFLAALVLMLPPFFWIGIRRLLILTRPPPTPVSAVISPTNEKKGVKDDGALKKPQSGVWDDVGLKKATQFGLNDSPGVLSAAEVKKQQVHMHSLFAF